ncbi:MAG: DUF2075 domain-containing protein, partial [Burkholderiales bacterium]|nr:DUF2075 domain-containing protein [Burkholderiales bacterium]
MTSTRAYYSSEIIDFLIEPADAIIGKIAQCHTQQLEFLQTGAWLSQITCLQQVLQPLGSGQILFEVLIPRMGRRVDVALIHQNILFLIEFKVGAKSYSAQDLRQAHGYAIDLHHFHEGSHDKIIIPILLATEAPATHLNLHSPIEGVYEPLCCNKDNLLTAISYCVGQITAPPKIDYQAWLHAPYKPTPTIIEAAQALYSQHNVADIARNDAGALNLHTTSEAIQNIIHQARLNKRKTICFVTGVPGAGKTLVGLNIATASTHQDHDEHAVFLSGNGPLVEVLTEALARDSNKRNPDTNKAKELRSAAAKIQNIHRFRDESLKDMGKAPAEHVVIFDEAQRAWDLANTAKFMMAKRGQAAFNQSEPDFLISVMDRHPDWCAIVALIG